MEPSSRPPSPPLVDHARYLRRLARALLRGRGWEDDVVQQAWLAALQRPAGTIRSPRAWLAGAVRHISLRKVREETRRTRREREAAVPEQIPPDRPPSERTDALRQVLDAVDTLADPYRDAIVRRYLEDQSPKEIAYAAGVAESTAQVWIHRGLKQLRATLDPDDDHERRSFLLALAPTAGIPAKTLHLSLAVTASKSGGPPAAHCGWWIMNGKALLSLAAAGVIGVSLWISGRPSGTSVLY